MRLTENDKDYAIVGAIPVEAEGITYIYGRQSCDTRAMEGGEIDTGNNNFGGQEPGMHDSRNDPQLAVHFVAEPAPGKHTIGMGLQYGAMSLCDICSWAPPAKVHRKAEDLIPNDTLAWIAKANACYSMLVDGAGGCYYAEMMGVHMWRLVDYLNAAAGWD
mgnify:CR=1 FL=1